jgi:hypothetical protein
MKRGDFLQKAGLLSGGLLMSKSVLAIAADRVTNRPALAKRNFTSKAVEDAIKEFKLKVKDEELSWLFENCFPNTLDTTVYGRY